MAKTRRHHKTRRAGSPRVWSSLEPAVIPPEALAAFVEHDLPVPDEAWLSDLFSVMVRYQRVDGVVMPREGLLWLSVHRLDRKAIRDWRHMQAIKNEVAGPDRIAVELYPAERDVVDTTNEYHLWVLPADFELPFGLGEGGLLMTPDEVDETDTKAKQRPWQDGIPTGHGLTIDPIVATRRQKGHPA